MKVGFLIVSLSLALLVGATAAWWGVPRLRIASKLDDIASPDADTREAAWVWLTPRASSLIDRINAALEAAPDDALLHAADELRSLDAWGWDRQPDELILRELTTRVGRDNETVFKTLEAFPFDRTFPGDLIETLPGPRLLDAVAGWAGPERADALEPFVGTSHDDELARAASLTIAVAALPDDVAPLRKVAGPENAIVLRYDTAPAAYETLEKMARDGNKTAVHVLQTRNPSRDESQARKIAIDDDQTPWMRRLGAWRWPQIGRRTLDEILALPPAEPDGSVFAAALLAERRLPADDAAALAESWIRDFDDDRKRAGALLAALLGVHQELLEEAYAIEDQGPVRTTQRLALHALGVVSDETSPRELAYRAMHRPNGDFAPDVLLCTLAARDADAARQLATQPIGDDWRLSVQQRAWLIQRFMPQWHAELGRPVGGDVDALHLHFELVAGLARLTARRLEYDEHTRTFQY